jgi:hypothetical protein
MNSQPSTHLWISTFAGRLMQLQPGLSMASAINCAVENFHRRHEFEPGVAAERSARAKWTRMPIGDAQEAHGPRQPPSARYQDMFGATT